MQTYMQGNTLFLHKPLTSGVGLKGQLLKLCRCKYTFFIKQNTKPYLTGGRCDLNDTEDKLQVKMIGILVCDLQLF